MIDLERIKAQIIRGKFIEQSRSNIGLLEDAALYREWLVLCDRWVEDEVALIDMVEVMKNSEYGEGYCQGVVDVLAILNSLITWPTNDLQQLDNLKRKISELMMLYAKHVPAKDGQP